MSADNRLGRTALALVTATVATITAIGGRPSSVEAGSVAAMQPGITTSFNPERSSTIALGCAPAFGLRIPSASTGEFTGRINATVNMRVDLVENGSAVRDITDKLAWGDVNFNLIDLKGEVLRTINRTPQVKVDYGFSESPDADAYKAPIGRASFAEGQLQAHLNEIRRFDRADGTHSWDEVSEFVRLVRKTAEGLKTYKDECGTETERGFFSVYPEYLYNGQQFSAGQRIEVADGCITDVEFTSVHYVAAPPQAETPAPRSTPGLITPAPVQQPVQSPPRPAPAQVPAAVK